MNFEPWNLGTLEPNLKDLTGYSRALYSNWLWHRPRSCSSMPAKGCRWRWAPACMRRPLSPSPMATPITCLDCPGLSGARRFGKGAPDKAVHRALSDRVVRRRRHSANHRRSVEGREFPDRVDRHGAGSNALARRETEPSKLSPFHTSPTNRRSAIACSKARRRLTPSTTGKPSDEIERLAKHHGRDSLMEPTQHVLFVHSGDAMPIEINHSG